MTKHTEQHLDNLAKKVIKASPLETPSLDFTATVMSKIEVAKMSSITTYRPLISKKSWFVIAALIIGLLVYVFTLDDSQIAPGLLDNVNLNVVTDNKFVDAVSGLMMSKVLVYAVTLFGAAWFLQISLLKHQFNKRLGY